ncbi:hypothetical protein P22_2001 [Propionispora sp. 2/2-37]|uniref:tyrosine-type recombinase/integrase n=1 Tax=Propionispora sp. 2/2-37 TaxID=1677858 RepID=UPI0006BB79A2|nr:tyrosine-type recombinase/integrase [Propionispora sp. 2/2-37]CUH95915.1 hypothetical protein P22_2001 [Propionispora sp. 2/2-37]
MKKDRKKSQRADGRFVVTKVINGKKEYFYSTISKKDAEKKRDGHIEALKVRPKNYQDITFGEYLDSWLVNVKEDNVCDKTLQSYESNIRVHIKPYLGSYKISEVSTPIIREFLTHCKNKVVCRKKAPTEEDLKKAKKISARTLQYIFVTLNAALEQARKDKIISENPCETIEKPTVKPVPIKTLSEQEKQKFFKIAKKEDFQLYTMCVIALDTGARLSEFLNLKKSKVDIILGRFIIDQATEQTKEGPKEGPTKNESSVRALKMTKNSLAVLKEYLVLQEQEIKEFGTHYIDNDYVFAKKDGALIPNYEISKRFKKIARLAGLRDDAHFHETRHTIATELIEMGVNQFKVQALLGHATLDMTKRYTHLNIDSQDEIVNKLNKKRSKSKRA